MRRSPTGGLREVYLECLVSNAPALAVYEACGVSRKLGSLVTPYG